jgi:hypothetical protein
MTVGNPVEEKRDNPVRAAGRGAIFGIAAVLFGEARKGVFHTSPVDWRLVEVELVTGSAGGIVMALILYALRDFRRRGFFQYFAAWVVAGIAAALLVVGPSIPRDGWQAIEAAVLFGAMAGIGLGGMLWIGARHRQSPR